MFQNILLPVDGSPVSMKAAQAGIASGQQTGARITAYYAIDPIPYRFSAEGAPSGDPMKVEVERRARKAGEKHVQALVKATDSAGVKCQSVAEIARPDEDIVATARKRKCDAIFLASHGLRGMKRLLLGSVTRRARANAGIPAIVHR